MWQSLAPHIDETHQKWLSEKVKVDYAANYGAASK